MCGITTPPVFLSSVACADSAFNHVVNEKSCMDKDFSFFCIIESAPLKITGLTPAYVEASLDALSRNALYTKKLQLEKYVEPEDDPTKPQPQTSGGHATRGATKVSEKEDTPIKKTMGYSKHIRGKPPTTKFKSTAFMRGPAKDFSLANIQQLARLTA